MSRCKICGEEYGSSLICSVCGTPKPKDADLEDRKPLSPQSAQEAKLKMIENCKKSVCKVNVTYDNGSGCHGTGWRGGENVIITNAHVVDTGSDKVHIKNLVCEFSKDIGLRNNMIPMKVAYMSVVEDIAVLVPAKGVLPEEITILEISGEDARLGEEVFTIGNPLHYKFTLMSGVVANPNYKRDYKESAYNSLQTTLTLNGGNSGGAVFNINGVVVGMATYHELKQTVGNVAIATPGGVIQGTMYGTDRIHGYGFCVKGEAILACIDRAELNM